MSYTQGYEDGVRAAKAEFLKFHKEELEIQHELLEALELFVKAGIGNSADYFSQCEANSKAIAAIAKARGEA